MFVRQVTSFNSVLKKIKGSNSKLTIVNFV